jgi:hypothetical protein
MKNQLIRFEAKSQIATKEFELNVSNDKLYLTVCAYGDLWQEEFLTLEDLKTYLNKEWQFIDFSFLGELEK